MFLMKRGFCTSSPSFSRRWRMCTITVLLDPAMNSSSQTARNSSSTGTTHPRCSAKYSKIEYSSGVQRTGFSSTVTVRASLLMERPLNAMMGPASSAATDCSRVP